MHEAPALPERAPLDSDALLAGLSRADPEAFEAFYSVYFRRVYAYAARRRPGPREAQALAEAILTEAVGSLETGPAAAPLAIQVFRIAHRLAKGGG